ncbi:hypothetical protein MP228_010774 [Amoeboaphelidium protococcarum]|nr:hypothetical protein MP228_010774 [Amoeboaphelidium protococcarum]
MTSSDNVCMPYLKGKKRIDDASSTELQQLRQFFKDFAKTGSSPYQFFIDQLRGSNALITLLFTDIDDKVVNIQGIQGSNDSAGNGQSMLNSGQDAGQNGVTSQGKKKKSKSKKKKKFSQSSIQSSELFSTNSASQSQNYENVDRMTDILPAKGCDKSNLFCKFCKRRGSHEYGDCPELSSRLCSNCNQRGHYVDRCPKLRVCFKCGSPYHMAYQCVSRSYVKSDYMSLGWNRWDRPPASSTNFYFSGNQSEVAYATSPISGQRSVTSEVARHNTSSGWDTQSVYFQNSTMQITEQHIDEDQWHQHSPSDHGDVVKEAVAVSPTDEIDVSGDQNAEGWGQQQSSASDEGSDMSSNTTPSSSSTSSSSSSDLENTIIVQSEQLALSAALPENLLQPVDISQLSIEPPPALPVVTQSLSQRDVENVKPESIVSNEQAFQPQLSLDIEQQKGSVSLDEVTEESLAQNIEPTDEEPAQIESDRIVTDEVSRQDDDAKSAVVNEISQSTKVVDEESLLEFPADKKLQKEVDKRVSVMITSRNLVQLLQQDDHIFVTLSSEHLANFKVYSFVMHDSYGSKLIWNVEVNGPKSHVEKGVDAFKQMIVTENEDEEPMAPNIPNVDASSYPQPLLSSKNNSVAHSPDKSSKKDDNSASTLSSHSDIDDCDDGTDGWGQDNGNAEPSDVNIDHVQNNTNSAPSQRARFPERSRDSDRKMEQTYIMTNYMPLRNSRIIPLSKKPPQAIGFCNNFNAGKNCMVSNCPYIHLCNKCKGNHRSHECTVPLAQRRPCLDYNKSNIMADLDHQGLCQYTAVQCPKVHSCAYCFSSGHTLIQCHGIRPHLLPQAFKLLQQMGYIDRSLLTSPMSRDAIPRAVTPNRNSSINDTSSLQSGQQLVPEQPSPPRLGNAELCLNFNRLIRNDPLHCRRAHLCDHPIIYRRLAPKTIASLNDENLQQLNKFGRRDSCQYEYKISLCLQPHPSQQHGVLLLCSEWNNTGKCPRAHDEHLVDQNDSDQFQDVSKMYAPCLRLHLCSICKSPEHPAINCSGSISAVSLPMPQGRYNMSQLFRLNPLLSSSNHGDALSTLQSSGSKRYICPAFNEKKGCILSDWHCDFVHACWKCYSITHSAPSCGGQDRKSVEFVSTFVQPRRMRPGSPLHVQGDIRETMREEHGNASTSRVSTPPGFQALQSPSVQPAKGSVSRDGSDSALPLHMADDNADPDSLFLRDPETQHQSNSVDYDSGGQEFLDVVDPDQEQQLDQEEENVLNSSIRLIDITDLEQPDLNKDEEQVAGKVNESTMLSSD